MILSIVMQLFFVAKPWALVPLKAILEHFSDLVLVQFEHF